MKKVITYLMITFGTLILLAGIYFAGLYLFEAVIERIGEPDQSLIFWYLPILFIGLGGIGIGILLLVFGIKRLRTRSESNKQ